MKINFSIKKLVLGILVAVVGLMTLIALSFSFFSVPKLEYSETGFSLLDFASDELGTDSWTTAVGIVSILMLLLSIATIVCSVLSIFLFSNKVSNRLLLGLSIPCLIMTLIFMLLGIIFLYSGHRSLSINRWYGYEFYSTTKGDYLCSTSAYIGFILTFLPFIAYIICGTCIKEKEGGSKMKKEKVINPINTPYIIAETNINEVEESPVISIPAYTVEMNKAIAESLKIFKDLLDGGVITQEEFIKKKNEILK